jgi:hypothetical protein
MAEGTYHEAAKELQKKTGAKLVLILVVEGDRGNGFAVVDDSAGAIETKNLPYMLRLTAKDIERQFGPQIVAPGPQRAG